LIFPISLEIRVVHFPQSKDVPNAEISREINPIDREGVIGLRAMQQWKHCFKDSDHSLEYDDTRGVERLVAR
jgi:hypothetical protein